MQSILAPHPSAQEARRKIPKTDRMTCMFTEIDHIKVHYDIRGAGEPVLLLHGWGANITLFDNLMNLLSAKYKAVALDMPGFGQARNRQPLGVWTIM